MLYKFLLFFVRIFLNIYFRIEIHGGFELPKDTRLIICPNHRSNFDPVLIAIAVDRPVHYMAKKELYKNPVIEYLLKKVYTIPVDRENPGRQTIKDSLEVLENEEVLGIFMEGTRVKEFSMDNANAGVGLIAVRGKSNILPIKIQGTYKPFSKMDIYFREIIEIDDFKKKKESYQEIANKTLLRIYGKDEDVGS